MSPTIESILGSKAFIAVSTGELRFVSVEQGDAERIQQETEAGEISYPFQALKD